MALYILRKNLPYICYLKIWFILLLYDLLNIVRTYIVLPTMGDYTFYLRIVLISFFKDLLYVTLSFTLSCTDLHCTSHYGRLHCDFFCRGLHCDSFGNWLRCDSFCKRLLRLLALSILLNVLPCPFYSKICPAHIT